MKAILEFNLPEDSTEYKRANDATSLWCAVIEFDSILRNRAKYGDNKATADEVRKILHQCLIDEGVDLHD
jgi:hypothetical protein